MKVYVGYECYHDYCETYETAVKVFSSELKAILWKESVESTEQEWREYKEMPLE